MDADNPEETGNSVHGKLVQGEEENHENGKIDKKKKRSSNTLLDYKIDIYIRRHSLRGDTSSVKKYRTDMKKCCLCSCIFLLCLAATGVGCYFLITYLIASKPPEVRTLNGVVRGQVVSSPQGGSVEEYLGIPFAKPPLGPLRYADPVPIESFAQEPYEANDYGHSCMQNLDLTYGDFEGSNMWNPPNPVSEDCLYLNIWVPKQRKEKMTVLVWIYGGGFFAGSNALPVYDGKALSTFTDAVVCSFNYRVGTFGYLATGDGRIKGNFGMKDQVLALKWIRDNIAAFGGNPDSVTIFGESSGASSAGLHLMSTHSENLFNRAIFESGSPDAHWSFMPVKAARERSKILFDAIGCPDDNDVLECMRKLPAQFILDREWVDSNFMVFPWAPTVDGDFLVDTPYNLLKAGKFQKKDALLGVNKDEGTYWLLYALPGFTKDGPSYHNYTMFRDGVEQINWDLTPADRDRVKQLYSPTNTNDLNDNRDALDKVSGDRSFTCPTKELADYFIEQGIKTYFYYLTYRATNEVWPPWMGVIHGAEIQWVFGVPMIKSRDYTEEEIKFSQIIMSYWINFAKTGNPNGEGLPRWPQYDLEEKTYLEWKGPNDFEENTLIREKHCRFWSGINKYLNNDS